jgi:PAS domain S-box-containing protein
MGPKRVLIVEDDGIIGMLIHRHLLEIGYLVAPVVFSGEEAVSAARQFVPDVIIMDISLQGELDGIETARQIRLEQDIPIVYLTAFTDQETLERAKQTDPYGFLRKPFDVRTLEATIEIALNKHYLSKRLKQSEENYRQLFSSMQEAFALHEILLDENGIPVDYRFLEVNPAFEKILGLKASETIGKTIKELMPDIEPFWIETYGRVALTREPASFENYTDSLGRYFRVSAFCPQVGRFATFFMDITEQKMAEEALRSSEERFRVISEDSPLGIYVADPKGDYVYINQAYQQISGLELPEAVGQGWLSAIYAEDRSWVNEEWYKASRSQEMFQGVYRFQRKNQEVVWTSVKAGPIRNQQEVIGYVGLVEDITERRSAELALRETRDYLENLLNYANAPIVVWDAHLRITRFNHAIERLTGLMSAQVLGQTIEILFPEDKRERVLHMATKGERWEGVELQILGADGGERIVLWNSSEIFGPDGSTIVATIAQGQDITERKHAEQALAEERALLARRVQERTADLSIANAELARAARMKDEFLASMSHELRTPLTGILGLAEALQRNVYGDLQARQAAVLHNIEESGRHLLALINDILDLSKIEAGKLTLDLSPVLLENTCQSSLRLVRQDAQKKQIRVSLSFDNKINYVLADDRRLKQILVNLLSNAVKFTPNGGEVSLEVVGDRSKGVLILSVRDTGIGIQPQDMQRLFAPFVQLDSSLSRQYSGTGLGLSLVLRMVELHGGGITVDSQPGKGSCFIITLPWKEVNPREVSDNAVNNSGKVSGLPSFRQTIKEEDFPEPVEQLIACFQQMQIQNSIWRRSEFTLERAAQFHPDVIFADLALSEIEWLDVIQKLKSDPKAQSIPVIGFSLGDGAGKGQPSGILKNLEAPLDQSQIRDLLQTIFQTRKIEKALVVLEGEKARLHGHLVMVAEDNELNMSMLSDFLTSHGYQVIGVRNGTEAVERAREMSPDIILMDVQMPVLDGLEATRRIRNLPNMQKTPIIALTALAMSGDRERCVEAGVDEYISKPVSLGELLKVIRAREW